MYAVGRLGSYITRGVYTVSSPFHPFGGAVDIIVVEQQDGSFKSSPWYIRFGKFQGVLKAKGKVVKISVNGVEADAHMYLDHKGEAYFLREVDTGEGDSVFYPSSSGEDTDGQSSIRRPVKSKSYNYDASSQSDTVTQIDVSNGKILARSNSRRSRILGFVLGRKSVKGNRSPVEDASLGIVRTESWERAEIAADLLEVRWSTNLASLNHRKDNASRFSSPDGSILEADKDLETNDGLAGMGNNFNHPVLHEVHHNEISNVSPFTFRKLANSDEEAGIEMHSLNIAYDVGPSDVYDHGCQGNGGWNSETTRKNGGPGLENADHDEKAMNFGSVKLGSFSSKEDDKEQVSDVNDVSSPGNGVAKEKDGDNQHQNIFGSDVPKKSSVELTTGQITNENPYVSCSCAEVYVHTNTFHEAAELLSNAIPPQQGSLLVEEPFDIPPLPGVSEGGKTCNTVDTKNILANEEAFSGSLNSIITETYTQMLTVDPIDGSIKEVESHSICSVSDFNNSMCGVQYDKNVMDGKDRSKEQSSNFIDDYQDLGGDSVLPQTISISQSEDSEEEQLLFGDVDDSYISELKYMESISAPRVEKENNHLLIPVGNEALIKSHGPDSELNSSPDKVGGVDISNDVEDFSHETKVASTSIDIPRSSKVAGEEFRRTAESLPNIWSHRNDMDVNVHKHSLGHSLYSNAGSSNWMSLKEEDLDVMKSDDIKEPDMPTAKDAQISEEIKSVALNPVVGDPLKPVDPLSGNWRGWPFSLKRSRTMRTVQSAQNPTITSNAENILKSSNSMDGGQDSPSVKENKKKVRELTPTSEQLASLNLKEGKNTVTFTFSTAMLGPQQVDARIYLWKWDTRVVISDVDGTITKSDVLGQFMPLVGIDWSQTGVAHLFSAIKENGYQLLFLSARAISQAYHTRQFLFNLKQDGKALPDGPVIISPDGLFPSLFREVIRRAPHEFKIACLEDIRALFPPEHNPFYAGFGNRDTDEISYLKVGIPKGKVFIINPKGEVAVNRRVDTKSYTSLHDLVHGIFPPMSSSEQEEFNSWNFWKLPPPAINV